MWSDCPRRNSHACRAQPRLWKCAYPDRRSWRCVDPAQDCLMGQDLGTNTSRSQNTRHRHACTETSRNVQINPPRTKDAGPDIALGGPPSSCPTSMTVQSAHGQVLHASRCSTIVSKPDVLVPKRSGSLYEAFPGALRAQPSMGIDGLLLAQEAVTKLTCVKSNGPSPSPHGKGPCT